MGNGPGSANRENQTGPPPGLPPGVTAPTIPVIPEDEQTRNAGGYGADYRPPTRDPLPGDPTYGYGPAEMTQFGTLDTTSSARKVVISETRSGYINAHSTDAPAGSPSTRPRFHPDKTNSGDYARGGV